MKALKAIKTFLLVTLSLVEMTLPSLKAQELKFSESAYKFSCRNFFQDLQVGRNIFADDGRSVYFLAKIYPDRSNDRGMFVYRYFKFDIVRQSLVKLFDISVGNVDYIVSTGNPHSGIVLVDHRDESNPCTSGLSDYLFISLKRYRGNLQGKHTYKGRDKLIPIKTKNSFGIFNYPESSVLLFDPVSMQKRKSLIPVKSIESLHFVKSPSRVASYFTVVDDAAKRRRGLIFYRVADVVSRRLEVSAAEKLIRYGEHIAVISFEPAQNILTLGFLPNWSHMGVQSKFDISVHRSQSVMRAKYAYDRKHHRVLILGGEGGNRLTDDRMVKLYDIRRNSQISSYKAPLGSKIAWAGILEANGTVILELQTTGGLSDAIFYTNENLNWRWKKLTIER